MTASICVETPEGREWMVVSGLMGIDGPAVVVPISTISDLTDEQIGQYVRLFTSNARHAQAGMQAEYIRQNYGAELRRAHLYADELTAYKPLLLEFAEGDSHIQSALNIIEEAERTAARKKKGDGTKKKARAEARKQYDTLFLLIGRRDGFNCQSCGRTTALQIDHIFPVSLGGETEADNLQILCRRCNSSKGNQVIDYRGTLRLGGVQ